MTYMEAVNKAIEAVIDMDEENGLAYLQPMYRYTLRSEGYVKSQDSEEDLPTEDEMAEILKLYVKKHNVIADKTSAVVTWLYDVITQVVDPAVTAEDNELIKNMMEYMQLNESLKNKEKELDTREAAMDTKETIGKVVPIGMSFAKRKEEE